MTYKAIIFDLDGTLVNSIYDIADSMNTVLKSYNYPTHDYEAYKIFVGSGIKSLVVKALPETHNNEEQVKRCFDEMMVIYKDNCTNKTKAYDGIIELLDQLKAKDIKLAVLSNKADAYTKIVVSTLFPNYFNPILGLKKEADKKPSPIAALEISKTLNINTNQIIFVGDTDVDMQTASNANMHAVGVLWGFRKQDELIANGAKHILKHPSELLDIL